MAGEGDVLGIGRHPGRGEHSAAPARKKTDIDRTPHTRLSRIAAWPVRAPHSLVNSSLSPLTNGQLGHDDEHEITTARQATGGLREAIQGYWGQ